MSSSRLMLANGRTAIEFAMPDVAGAPAQRTCVGKSFTELGVTDKPPVPSDAFGDVEVRWSAVAGPSISALPSSRQKFKVSSE